MLIPFRYTSQSNLPDSNVAAVERKENERIERERERDTQLEEENVKSLRNNKRFHSPYPGRISGRQGEGGGRREIGENDEIYSL